VISEEEENEAHYSVIDDNEQELKPMHGRYISQSSASHVGKTTHRQEQQIKQSSGQLAAPNQHPHSLPDTSNYKLTSANDSLISGKGKLKLVFKEVHGN